MNNDVQRAEDAIRKEYGRLAPKYDTKWAYYVHATMEETLRRLDVRPNDRVLDVGCGTASLLHALSAAHPDAELLGLDLSIEMLGMGRNKLGRAAKLVNGRAQSLPFASRSFDVVVSCNAFHFWREPEAALREMARVVRPTGKIVITDWCDDYLACRVCDLWLRWFDPAYFRAYGQRECDRLLERSGYHNIHIERYKIGWLWGLMTVRAKANSS